MDSEERIIVALDGMDRDESLKLISKLPNVRWVKIGLELFVDSGPEIINELRQKGLKVFLDLKFHDIPKTTANACYRAASYGAELITIHACSGKRSLIEAKYAAEKGAKESGFAVPRLLAVTVLTSWDQIKFAKELAIDQRIEDRVEILANLAKESDISGCVCSPLEVQRLRMLFPLPFELVTPGIRPAGFDLNDQSRVMTPIEAISAGSSRLVIGRPITRSNDPEKVFSSCCLEIQKFN